MAKRNSSDNITITFPSVYEVHEVAPQAASSRTRGGRAKVDAEADAILDALVDEHHFTVKKTYALDLRGDFKKRKADVQPDTTKVQIKVEKGKEDEQLLMLIEEDGLYHWEFAKHKEGGKRSTRGARDAEVEVFEIDLAGYIHRDTQRRSLSEKAKTFAEKVKAHVVSFKQAASISNLTIKRLEKDVTQCAINLKVDEGADRAEAWQRMENLSALKVPKTRPAKVLLLVHGTFSSTVGSYGGLCKIAEGRAFLKQAFKDYDIVLGFDHYTLSETPVVNAREILKCLKKVSWPEKHPPVIDAIGYSRGGLVLRSMIEWELPNDGWPATVRKAIFVGATNGGTELAKPENWYRYIDYYTNLAAASARILSFISGGGLAGPVFTGMIRGVGAFAKYLATSSVTKAKIPGLAAMEPDGEFVKDLNQTQEKQPGPDALDYFAITSDFSFEKMMEEGSPGIPQRFKLSLWDGFADQLMGGAPNDLVVHTASMTHIDPHVDNWVKEQCAFGTNGQVYHTVYFIQPITVYAIAKWLGLSKELKVEDDKTDTGSHKRGAVRINDREEVFYRALKQAESGEPELPADTPKGQEVNVPKLTVSVHWADITKVKGDVFATGHYRGVEPQSAELAIDKKVSGVSGVKDLKWKDIRKKLVLTRLTQQGLLVGDLGDIDFFPWDTKSSKMAAICGMGFYNGDFTEQNLRLLYRRLALKLNTLPGVNELCTVLIGSGVGSLDVKRALRGQLNGYADAMSAFPAQETLIKEVKIVEYDKLKAYEIHDHLLELSQNKEIELDLIVKDEVQSNGSGGYTEVYTLSLIIGAVLRAYQSKKENPKGYDALEAFIDESNISGVTTQNIKKKLGETWKKLEKAASIKASIAENVDPNGECKDVEIKSRIDKAIQGMLSEVGLSRTISVQLATQDRIERDIPNRLSVRLQDNVYRIAGLTKSSAVPEREVRIDVKLVQELIERMTDPNSDLASRHGRVLYQLLIPGVFEELLTSCASLVFEVDRHTAPIHWEMLVLPNRDKEQALGLTLPLSRQLRTTYSNVPAARYDHSRRALVIGDPDGSLQFAEEEALKVSEILEKAGFTVDLFIGSPDEPKSSHKGEPANRLDVLEKLFEGEYAIVHYAGHGDYNPEDPSETGWCFASGLLTAGEFARLKDAPSLIFANACLSGRTSATTAHAHGDDKSEEDHLQRPLGEAGLLPSLADEVLKLGVRNYIGTAWEVDDEGAVLFAEEFYNKFVEGESIGEAVLSARKKLKKELGSGALWAAYQHYGSPDYILSNPSQEGKDGD